MPGDFVVERAAGERTEAPAQHLVQEKVGRNEVTTIREVPFATALRCSLETGVRAGRRWTLCLDADILLRPGAIATLVTAAEAPADTFGATGLVADKVLVHERAAGRHFCRTALSDKALGVGSFDPAMRHPETVVKKAMARAGHPTISTDALMGSHDFEQSCADIFRKVFTHTRKHARFMTTAVRVWRRQAEDPDHLAACVPIEAQTKDRNARILARLRHHGVAAPLWFAGTALERSGLRLRRRSGDIGT